MQAIRLLSGPALRVFKSEKTQVYIILALAIILIGSKGAPQGFFGSVFNHYIEETAASVNDAPEMTLADIGDLTSNQGHGGNDTSLALTMVSDNSIQATYPASNDYLLAFTDNKITEYAVSPGDTISFIASDFGVSVNTILWANNLRSPNDITMGQVLKIPPIDGVIHTVKAGDSVESIAKRYSAQQDEITVFNDLNLASALQIGSQIIVPDGVINTPAAPAATAINPRSVSASFRSSVVNIAKKFAYLPDLGNYFDIPTLGHDWGIVHDRNGVDIANACGTAIEAAASGTAEIVDASGYNGGFGKYIKIVHPNDTETLYAHLSKILIAPGQAIKKGQEIGLMGTTGHSTGCHLHFEVHGARNPLAKY